MSTCTIISLHTLLLLCCAYIKYVPSKKYKRNLKRREKTENRMLCVGRWPIGFRTRKFTWIYMAPKWERKNSQQNNYIRLKGLRSKSHRRWVILCGYELYLNGYCFSFSFFLFFSHDVWKRWDP